MKENGGVTLGTSLAGEGMAGAPCANSGDSADWGHKGLHFGLIPTFPLLLSYMNLPLSVPFFPLPCSEWVSFSFILSRSAFTLGPVTFRVLWDTASACTLSLVFHPLSLLTSQLSNTLKSILFKNKISSSKVLLFTFHLFLAPSLTLCFPHKIWLCHRLTSRTQECLRNSPCSSSLGDRWVLPLMVYSRKIDCKPF